METNEQKDLNTAKYLMTQWQCQKDVPQLVCRSHIKQSGITPAILSEAVRDQLTGSYPQDMGELRLAKLNLVQLNSTQKTQELNKCLLLYGTEVLRPFVTQHRLGSR